MPARRTYTTPGTLWRVRLLRRVRTSLSVGLYLPPLAGDTRDTGRLKRNHITYLFLVHGQRCWWCRRRTRLLPPTPDNVRPPDQATRDHYMTQSRGGATCLRNQVLACSACNNERGNKPVKVWEGVMARRGYPPQKFADLLSCRAQGRLWPHVPLPQPLRPRT